MLRNPVRYTGAIRHCYLWATSSWSDSYYANPTFNKESQQPRTIYCVHGTADRSGSFSLIADRILNKLPDDVKGIHLLTFCNRARATPVASYSEQLKDKILENKDENVILMGHSRGALVACLFALLMAKDNNITVDKVVSICGPLKGSNMTIPFAWLIGTLNEMAVDSDFLKDLSERILASDISFLFVGAEQDQLVRGDSYLPYGLVATEENSLLLDRHAHLSIQSSHRLVTWLSEKFKINDIVADNSNIATPTQLRG